MKLNYLIIIMLFISLFVNTRSGKSQIHSPAISKDTVFRNTVSGGPSLGFVLDRNAWFWGVAINYSYQVDGPWAISPSLVFDQEINKTGSTKSVVNTSTLIGTISYFLTDKISLTTGLAKGFLDDDNAEGELSLSNGDWSTGIAIGYSLPNVPVWDRDSFGIGLSYEYNLTKGEFNISVDLSIGLAF